MGDGISANAADAEFELRWEIVIMADEGLDGFVGGGSEGGDGFIYVFVYGLVEVEGGAVAGGDDEGDGIYWPSVGGCCYFIG